MDSMGVRDQQVRTKGSSSTVPEVPRGKMTQGFYIPGVKDVGMKFDFCEGG